MQVFIIQLGDVSQSIVFLPLARRIGAWERMPVEDVGDSGMLQKLVVEIL